MKAMCCSNCGSQNIRRNADVVWDVTTQKWEIVSLFDSCTCDDCDTECKIIEKKV
jgi:hypothetical protein